MPTYSCLTAAGLVDSEQRRRIAHGIADIHSHATGAPIGFTQCIFREIVDGSHFIGGVPAPRHTVWVHGLIRAGRRPEVKDQILRKISNLVTATLRTDTTDVWVYLQELRHTDMVEFGRVLPASGEEPQWLDELPHRLRNQLVTPLDDF